MTVDGHVRGAESSCGQSVCGNPLSASHRVRDFVLEYVLAIYLISTLCQNRCAIKTQMDSIA
jgi:hypothetical protein